MPNAVGWELNRGRKVPRCISLSQSLDPTRFVARIIFSGLHFVLMLIISLAFCVIVICI